MPRQIIQKKEAPVMIKNTNVSSSFQQNILPSEPEATGQFIRYDNSILNCYN